MKLTPWKPDLKTVVDRIDTEVLTFSRTSNAKKFGPRRKSVA